MANITNPEHVNFSNNCARRLNDQMASAYRTCKQFKALWDTNGYGTAFATGADVIIDGATVLSGTADGRHPATSQDMNNLYSRVSAFITDFEANTNLKLNQANAIAVNTNPLF